MGLHSRMRCRCLGFIRKLRPLGMSRQRMRLRMMVRDMKRCTMIELVHWIRGIVVSRRVWENRFRMMI